MTTKHTPRVTAGTIVRLPDGREGTVVYKGLDGIGIQWGRKDITLADIIEASNGEGPLFGTPPAGYPYLPEAMLCAPYKGADANKEYVGDVYEVIDALTQAQP